MNPFLEKRPAIIMLAILALGALTLLSSSLRNISFRDAQPIGRQEATPFAFNPAPALEESFTDTPLGPQIIVWVTFSVMAVLIGLLLSPETRKKLLRIFIRVAFTYWTLYFLFKYYPDLISKLFFPFAGNAAARQVDETLETVPSPVFTPPQNSPTLSYAVSLVIILIMLFLVWKMFRAWKQSSTAVHAKPMDELAHIARSSLRDLSSGGDSTDVIINCYVRMSDVVAEKKSLYRGISMTPAEFSQRLIQAGLPSDAVQRLTNLFEIIRYGNRKAGPKEINEAVSCLTSILQYCGESV